jgi:hypothetical protein
MKNNCKSCNHSIDDDALFCLHCGAKVVNGRLSLKGTWHEFIGPFFSWENNFWRTFKDLFTNPKKVLEAYVGGARKKYFQPFSYLILFATIAIFFYKIFPMEVITDFSEGFSSGFNSGSKLNPGNKPIKPNPIDNKAIGDFIMNYYNFVMILMLPFSAMISFILFKKRNHNFAEHLVFNSYLSANLGYLGLIIQLIIVNILKLDSTIYANLYLFLSLIYTIYAFKDLYSLSSKQSFFAFIKYVGIYIGIFLLIGIIAMIIMIIGLLINKFLLITL